MCSLQDHRNYIARDSKIGPVLLSVKTEEDYQGTMMRALLRYVGTVTVVCCMCGQCTCLTVLCAIIVLCVDSPSLFIYRTQKATYYNTIPMSQLPSQMEPEEIIKVRPVFYCSH